MELHLATYLDLAHGGGGRVQGLRLLLVPLLPLDGGTLLLIARLLHTNHLRSKVEVIKKDHLRMYYLKNIYWARIFKKTSNRERLQFVVAFCAPRQPVWGRRQAKQMPLEAANSSYLSRSSSNNSVFLREGTKKTGYSAWLKGWPQVW